MPLEWSPTPQWALTAADGTQIDLTGRALAWDVLFGCSYDAQSGRWTLVTARGSIRLDNSDGRLDPAADGALIDVATLSIPRPITLTLAGETLWQGHAVVTGSRPLRGDAAVTWQLRGRYWQAIRSEIGLRQLTPHDSPQVAATKLAAAAASPRRAADPISPASVWPTGVRLRDVTVDEPLGRAWARLAHAVASIPFEDRTGRLGMASLQGVAAGRQLDAPPGQRALDDSTIHTIGAASIWSIDVVGKHIVRAETADVTVTTPDGGATRSVAAEYAYRGDVHGVEWTDARPTAPAGWTVVWWQALPARGIDPGDVLRAVLRRDVANAQPSGVRFVGRSLRADTDSPLVINSVSPQIDGIAPSQARVQTTAPWIDHTDPAFDLDAWAKMAQFHAEPKVRAELTYPLWGDTPADRIPANIADRSGQLVPASMSRYRVDDDTVIDMITETVELRGTSVTVPTATVAGITASGLGTADDPVDPGIPILGGDRIPKPWDPVEPPPATGTPTVPTPTGLAGVWDDTAGTVTLTWDDPPPIAGVTRWLIRRDGRFLALLDDAAARRLVDRTPTRDSEHRYELVALTQIASSRPATVDVSTRPAPPPPPPLKLMASESEVNSRRGAGSLSVTVSMLSRQDVESGRAPGWSGEVWRAPRMLTLTLRVAGSLNVQPPSDSVTTLRDSSSRDEGGPLLRDAFSGASLWQPPATVALEWQRSDGRWRTSWEAERTIDLSTLDRVTVSGGSTLLAVGLSGYVAIRRSGSHYNAEGAGPTLYLFPPD